MERLVIDIKSKKDEVLLRALLQRLRLKSRVLTEEELEDIGLWRAMQEGKKSGKASEKEVMEILNKWS